MRFFDRGDASDAKCRGHFAKTSADAGVWVRLDAARGFHCCAEDGRGVIAVHPNSIDIRQWLAMFAAARVRGDR